MEDVLIGQTDYTIFVDIQDDAGAPATGLTESSIDIAYARIETDNDVTTTDVTPAALTALTDTHTDWGFEEVSATDHPGLYRLDSADAVFASGAWKAVITVTGTGLHPCKREFRLVSVDLKAATMPANYIAATSITNDAITAAKVADGAIDAATFAAGAITATVIATGAIDADAIADNAIDAGALAADCITAAKIANGAIDAATFAADVDAEILSYIVDDATRIDASALNTAAVTSVPAILEDTGTTLQGELDGIQADVEDIQSKIGTPAGASIAADIAAIEAQTDDIGVAGAGLTAVPWNAAWDAEVESEATDALNAYDPPTRAEATADKNEIVAYLAGLVIAKGTIGATGNDTTHLHLTGLTYGDDEINNYLIAIKDVSTGEWHARYVEDWSDAGDLVTVATLPFTPENSVDLYAILAFRQDVTGGSGLDAAGVRAAVGLASANLDTQLGAIDDLVDTEVGAIKTVVDAIQAKTDNLPSDPADASVVAGLIDAVDNFVDTEVAAILADTNAIKLKTDNLPSDPADASVVAGLIAAAEAKVDAVKAKTDSLTFTEAGIVDANVQKINDVDITGDGQAGTEFGV